MCLLWLFFQLPEMELKNFPSDSATRKAWCNLIKRQERMDGFRINKSTRVCERHFPTVMIIHHQELHVKDSKPTLHPWNNFGKDVLKRKTPTYRPFPKKVFRTDDRSSNKSDLHVEDTEFELLQDEIKKLKSENNKLISERDEFSLKCTFMETTIKNVHETVDKLNNDLKYMPTRKTDFASHAKQCCTQGKYHLPTRISLNNFANDKVFCIFLCCLGIFSFFLLN